MALLSLNDRPSKRINTDSTHLLRYTVFYAIKNTQGIAVKLKKPYRITLFLLTLFSLPPQANSETAGDIEYLPDSDYESALGAGIYQSKNESIGFYVNMQLTLNVREPHYDSLNITSFGDPVTDRYRDIFLINAGITKQLAPFITGYAGAGLASVTGIAQKDDPSNILASDGKYYVDDPQNDETGGNINAGVIIKAGSLAFNIGYHTFTNSAYFGIGAQF